MPKRDASPVRLSLLDNLQIASPCSASWDAMKGDDRVRFCGSCKKNVYNLSAMLRGEAEALLEEREGKVCVRLYRRADGTVMTSDCSVGARKKRVRREILAAVAGAGALASAAAWSFAHSASAVVTSGTPQVTRESGGAVPPGDQFVHRTIAMGGAGPDVPLAGALGSAAPAHPGPPASPPAPGKRHEPPAF